MNAFKNAAHFRKATISVRLALASLLFVWFILLKLPVPNSDHLFIYSFAKGETRHAGRHGSMAARLLRLFMAFAGSPLTVNDMRHIHGRALHSSDECQRQKERERMLSYCIHT